MGRHESPRRQLDTGQSSEDAGVTGARTTGGERRGGKKPRRGKASRRKRGTVERAVESRYAIEKGFWICPLIAFVSLLALYVATLAPSVVGGDSGELTAAALTGGVPHPPGYPIFALLARAFAALPLGHTHAWRVNLLSATSTAAAAGFACAVVELWTRSRAAALATAALFGTNAAVWLHATAAEVFGLNACFVALACLLWLLVERTGSRRFVLALAFTSGLAMCNHQTFAFVGWPLVLRSLWVTRRRLGARGIGLAVAIGLLGLVPYAYLATASASQAAVSWGDQTTLDGLVAHVLRRTYGTFSMGQATEGSGFTSDATLFPTLRTFLVDAFPRSAWMGAPLGLAGFYLAGRDREARSSALVLALALASYVVGFSSLSNLSTSTELYPAIIGRFCIQSDLVLAIAAGLGCAKLLSWLRDRWAMTVRWLDLGYGIPPLVFVAGIYTHAGLANQRDDRVFPDFIQAAFASLPENAIVITVGDHISGASAYFREVEQLRPDVIHLDRAMLAFGWYGARKRRRHADLNLPEGGYGRGGWGIQQLLDGNPLRPVMVIDKLDSWDESWKQGYKLATQGLVHALVPASRFPKFEEWAARDRQAMGGYDVVPALRYREGSWENALGQLVLNTEVIRANIAMTYAIARPSDPAAPHLCATLFEDVIAKSGGDDRLKIPGTRGLPHLQVGASAFKDLGVCYEILGRTDGTFRPRVASAVQRFAELASPGDPALPAARKFLGLQRARNFGVR
jgi:hypothetical protein